MSIAVFIVLFVLVYGVVFGAGISYIRRLIKNGPEVKPADEPEALANRPISAALEEGQSAGNVAIASQRAE
jgi:cytochrome bd ubiquinol oxidase subunit I